MHYTCEYLIRATTRKPPILLYRECLSDRVLKLFSFLFLFSSPTRTCRVGCHVDKLGIAESLRIQCARSLILNHILMDDLPFHYRRSCATVKRTLIQAPISKTGLVLELRNGLRLFSLASSHSKCFWIFLKKEQKWKAEFFYVMALLLPNLFWFFGLIRYMLWFSSCCVSLITVTILSYGVKNFCWVGRTTNSFAFLEDLCHRILAVCKLWKF